MELLYIYFQDYRNFKQTAVPFSSEFTFTTSKKKNGQLGLKIERNPHFIPNFFNDPRIANVSAIIGQNGIGKSNILDFIRNALPDGMGGFTHECIVITKSRIFATNDFEYNIYVTAKIELACTDKTRLFNPPMKLKARSEGLITTSYSIPDSQNTSFIYYSNIVDLKIPSTLTRTKIESEEEPASATAFKNVSTMALLAQDQIDYSNSLETDVDKVDCYKAREFLRNYQFLLSDHKNLIGFRLPEYIHITVLSEDERQLRKKSEYQWLFDPIVRYEADFNNIAVLPQPLYWNYLMRAVYFNLVRAYLSSDNLPFDRRMITEASGDSFHLFFRDFIEKIINGVDYSLRNSDLMEKGRKILDFVDFMGEYLIKQGEMLLRYEDGVLILPVQSTGLFTFEKFFDKYFEAKTLTDFLVVRWRSISSGEQSYLTLFSRFYRASTELGNNRNALIIICDEADIYFHPEWQRKLLSSLLKYLPSIFQHKDIQLILTSNTPYLVSDLPASNVILIENNRSSIQVCNAAAAGKKTFAANIHSLLSDEFFVSNLIGEFAKEKIEAVIRFLDNPQKQPELNPQSVKAIIDSVGEPIIRQRLEDLYNGRFQPSRPSLQEEQRRLQVQLNDINRLLNQQQKDDKS